jgi:hypothetical protein
VKKLITTILFMTMASSAFAGEWDNLTNLTSEFLEKSNIQEKLGQGGSKCVAELVMGIHMRNKSDIYIYKFDEENNSFLIQSSDGVVSNVCTADAFTQTVKFVQ